MSRNITVDNIVDELRSLTDEFNEDQLESERDILPELNRAQERAFQILSRVYPEPLLTYTDITSGISGYEFELPEGIWMDKVKQIEFITPTSSNVQQCERVTLGILRKFYTQVPTPAPSCHALFERKVRFNAPCTGLYTLRLWHLREIDPLVLSIGRITNIDTVNNSFIFTDLNPNFNLTDSDLNQYFNVVDGQTGLVKSSFQVKSFNGVDEILIKTSPDRTSVLNRTISTSVSSPTSAGQTGYAISEDDYICPINGTCVLQFFDSAHTFIVQVATSTLKRKLGYAYDADQQLAKDFETELSKTYMGRNRITRVKHGNSSWIQRTGRFFYRRV